MDLFDGLYPYEKLLSILGIFFFFLLCFILVFKAIKGQRIKNLLYFFIIPVIMIGFPAITKIQIGDWLVELERQKKVVENNPKDISAKQELSELLSKLEYRPISKPDNLVNIAGAKAAIGDSTGARNAVNSILQRHPNFDAAVELNNRLNRGILVPRRRPTTGDTLHKP
jgi:hypothetical protein